MLNDLTVKKQITINASAYAVWEALTNPEKIKLYLFGTETKTDWKEGSPIVFSGTWEGTEYKDKGTILKFEKNKILQYDYWSSFSPLPDLPENYSLITFLLSSKGSATILSLEQKGFVDEKTLNHSSENWQSVLEKLKEVAEK